VLGVIIRLTQWAGLSGSKVQCARPLSLHLKPRQPEAVACLLRFCVDGNNSFWSSPGPPTNMCMSLLDV